MNTQLSSSIAIDFVSKMYLKSDFADIYFEFSHDNQVEKVPAHKSILATASPVFRQMFFGPLKEGDVIKIKHTTVDAFEEFLQFFYLNKITLTMGNIGEVVRLSDYYDVADCFEKCVDVLECSALTSENIAWGYQLAIMFNNQKLKEFCEKQISISTDDVIKSDMFLQCDQKVVNHILNIDTLGCKEADLFEACMSWAKASCQRNELDENDSKNLKEQLGDCFHSIRFGAMESAEIDKILANEVYESLFSRKELVDISRMNMNKTYKSQTMKYAARSSLWTLWNDSKLLHCDLTFASGQSLYEIQSTESTWFSSNKLVVLRSFSFPPVTNYCGQYYFDYNRHCIICINEYDTFDTNAPSNAPSKVLYRNTFQCYNTSDSFALSTFINPGKTYEIRSTDSAAGRIYHSYAWKTEVSLGDNIIINFLGDGNGNRRGCVASMDFNRF